jgi:phosphatidylinositol alpha-1,6-mannosyltransferase
MRRTLLVTNDFPPRPGGIQSYLHSFASQLPADELVVYAPRWRGDSHEKFDARQPFEVVRHPTTLMLPTPLVARRAAKIVKSRGCDSVWFGASAPLAVMSSYLRKAGADRIVASTHGHEVGWSMVPGGRATLRTIGENTDVVTYVSTYCRDRIAPALSGPARRRMTELAPTVDQERFHPGLDGSHWRRWLGLDAGTPVVLAASRLVRRKGQDVLIQAWPDVLRAAPEARLVIVGDGSSRRRLGRLARASGVGETISFVPGVPWDEMPQVYAMADVFALQDDIASEVQKAMKATIGRDAAPVAAGH